MKLLLLLTIFACTFGSGVGIEIGLITLSPYRILLILSLIFYIVKYRGKNNSISFNNSNSSILVFVLWILVSFFSILWVKDYSLWIKSVVFIASSLLLLLMMRKVFTSEKDIVLACSFFSVGVLIQCLIGWGEIFTGIYHFANQSWGYAGIYALNKMPVSMWYNVNDYATVLCFGFASSLISFIYSKKIISKLFFLFINLNCILLIVKTESRACIIGLILMIILILIFFKKVKYVVIPAVIVAIIYSSTLLGLFDKVFGSIGSADNSASDSTRMMLITDGIGFLINTFGFGVGAGQISIWSVEARGAMGGSIHNWWIEILVSNGIVFFIIYMLNYFRVFKNCMKEMRNKNSYRASFSKVFSAFLIGFLIVGVSSSSLITNEAMWTFMNIIFLADYLIIERRKTNELYSINMRRKICIANSCGHPINN